MSAIQVGEYVKVKAGVKAPDFDYQSMDGWQGKVTSVNPKSNTVGIEWDVKTLLATPYQYLHDIISGGLDYELMFLLTDELEISTKREASQEEELELDSILSWIDLYDTQEKNEKYGQIFKNIDTSDDHAVYQKWEEYLNDTLDFSFEVEVAEFNERFRMGASMKVLSLKGYDYMYGILGLAKYKSAAVTFPICNLEAVDKDSENFELLKDYVVWYANR